MNKSSLIFWYCICCFFIDYSLLWTDWVEVEMTLMIMCIEVGLICYYGGKNEQSNC